MTLQTLNAHLVEQTKAHNVKWDGVADERSSYGPHNATFLRMYAVGHNGQQRGPRGTTGAKLHLLLHDVVTNRAAENWKRGNFDVGQSFAVRGVCSGNGSYTGVIVEGADLADITCTKCLANLAKREARIAGQEVR